jgi:EmrB/QacA subfamily drug resistance transporter
MSVPSSHESAPAAGAPNTPIAAKWYLREPAPAALLERQSSYPWLVIALTCIAAFIGQVDASIVQLALPQFETVFDARLHAVSWVAMAYLLSFAGALPVFARLTEIAGRKNFYLLGFVLFGGASALCGFAPSLAWLIVFRVLQGVGGAMLGANSIVILVSAAGAEHKGRALGYFSAAQAVGISAGPMIGGVLLSALSWKWIFWVGVPFAVVAFVLGWLVIPRSTKLHPEQKFDALGALLLMPALTLFLLALTHQSHWGRMPTIACVVVAAVLLALFARRELTTASPLLDVRVFQSAPFAAGCMGVVLSFALLYAMFFTMSFALVRGYNDAPLAAGLKLAVIAIALGLVAPLSGGLSDKYPRTMPVVGMAICLASALALTQLLTGAPERMVGVLIALAAFGAGLGMFIAPNNTATLGAAPPEHAGQAGGLINLLRAFGTAFGIAAASAVLSWRMSASKGVTPPTQEVPQALLLSAVGDVWVMLAGFAVIAGAAALVRSDGRLSSSAGPSAESPAPKQ